MIAAATHLVAGALRLSDAAPVILTAPWSGEPRCAAALATPAMADAALDAAVAALPAAEAVPVATRTAALRQLADALDAAADAFAALAVDEVGCPVAQARALHVGSAVGCLRACADLAERHMFAEERAAARGGSVTVLKRPVGVAVGIVPWNVPLYLLAQKLGAAVAAGAPLVLKPSPENAATMSRLAPLLAALPLPAGMVQLLTGDADLGRRLVADARVAKVSFTGSTVAGRAVATACAARFARVTLELGGKGAAILLDDCDLAAPATRYELFLAMLQNNGQVCGAQSRVLVPRGRPDIIDALVALFDALRAGDPTDSATDVGPLATAAQAARVRGMLGRAGVGTRRLSRARDTTGQLIAPTLLRATADAEIAREEVFGPVTALLLYDDEDHAVRLANDSRYGLSCSVWSADPKRAASVGARLRCGTVGINSKRILDFAAPFGGWRQSGLGRELGPEGIDAYLETTSIIKP